MRLGPSRDTVSALLGIIFFFTTCALSAQGAVAFPLKIAPNQRHLADQNDVPFLWLGDTSWGLYAQVTREEAEFYLENRVGKGFTVIQSHLLPWNITDTNSYGHTPFLNADMTQPNEPYWQHVDWLVAQTAQRGLVSALLMANAATYEANAWMTQANARIYGRFLGARYQSFPHIVWLGGGDYGSPTPNLWRELAAGIEEGQEGHTKIMSFHPRGPGTSSYQFHADAWQDFNMIQSSVQTNPRFAYENCLHDYALTPVKPTVNGEPAYERMLGNYSDNIVRRNAYASFFSGACGLSYGADPIWNIGAYGWTYSSGAWVANLDFPGAFQMGYLKNLLTYYAWYQAGPDVILGSVIDPADRGANESYVSCLVATDSSFALVYFPDDGSRTSRTVRIPLSRFNAPVYLQWYDPTNGERISAGGPFPNTGEQTFTAPGNNFIREKDWVLEIFTAPWLNQPPTATLTAPAQHAALTAPATFTTTATAADADGTITRVEFFIGTTKLGEDSTAPYTHTFNNLPPGDYTLTAKAWDNRALSGVSAPVWLHVAVPAASAGSATVQLTADNHLLALYLNGTATPLGPNKSQWWQADTHTLSDLKCLALQCGNDTGGGAGALIGKITFPGGLTAATDFGWKVFYTTTGAPPPDDSAGRPWYATDYDDRAWQTAKSAGTFGIPPWGFTDALPMMAGAQWIWYQDPNNGVSPVYFRKTFGLPPPALPFAAQITTPTPGQVRLTWTSTPGTTYRVQFTADLTLPFTDLPNYEITATGPTTTYEQPLPGPIGYYRIRIVP